MPSLLTFWVVLIYGKTESAFTSWVILSLQDFRDKTGISNQLVSYCFIHFAAANTLQWNSRAISIKTSCSVGLAYIVIVVENSSGGFRFIETGCFCTWIAFKYMLPFHTLTTHPLLGLCLWFYQHAASFDRIAVAWLGNSGMKRLEASCACHSNCDVWWRFGNITPVLANISDL